MKRIISSSLIAVMFIFLISSFNVFASPDSSIVFVIDDSVSMKTNDATKGVEAAVSETLGTVDPKAKVGVVTYGSALVKSSPLLEMNDKNKTSVSTFLKNSLTQSADGADFAVGLKEADTMLASEQNKAIIIVTSGDNDYKGDRTAEKSAADINEVTAKKYPVYVVALNPNNDTRGQLENIAKSTGATATFPQNAEEMKAAVKSASDNIAAMAAPAPANNEVLQQPVTKSEDSASGNADTENVNVNVIEVPVTANTESKVDIEIYSQAKSGVIRVQHMGDVTFGLTGPTGLPIEFGTGTAELTKGDGYSEITLKDPTQGKWVLSVTDSMNETVKVIPTFEYSLKINFVNATNVIYTGVDTIYAVTITADSNSKIDTSNLTVRLFIKDDNSRDYKDMIYRNGQYECTYTCKTVGKKQISAVVMLESGNIGSNPINVIAVANPDADNNFGMWVKIAIGIVILIAIGNILFKYRKNIANAIEQKKMQGYISVEITQNTKQPIFIRDLSEFGKRKSLYDIIQNRALLEIQEVWVCGVTKGIKVYNTGSARVRFTHVSSNPEGVIVKYGQGFKVLLSDNKTEIMVRYFDGEEEAEGLENNNAPAPAQTPVPAPVSAAEVASEVGSEPVPEPVGAPETAESAEQAESKKEQTPVIEEIEPMAEMEAAAEKLSYPNPIENEETVDMNVENKERKEPVPPIGSKFSELQKELNALVEDYTNSQDKKKDEAESKESGNKEYVPPKFEPDPIMEKIEFKSKYNSDGEKIDDKAETAQSEKQEYVPPKFEPDPIMDKIEFKSSYNSDGADKSDENKETTQSEKQEYVPPKFEPDPIMEKIEFKSKHVSEDDGDDDGSNNQYNRF